MPEGSRADAEARPLLRAGTGAREWRSSGMALHDGASARTSSCSLHGHACRTDSRPALDSQPLIRRGRRVGASCVFVFSGDNRIVVFMPCGWRGGRGGSPRRVGSAGGGVLCRVGNRLSRERSVCVCLWSTWLCAKFVLALRLPAVNTTISTDGAAYRSAPHDRLARTKKPKSRPDLARVSNAYRARRARVRRLPGAPRWHAARSHMDGCSNPTRTRATRDGVPPPTGRGSVPEQRLQSQLNTRARAQGVAAAAEE